MVNEYFAELDRLNGETAIFRLFRATAGGDPMFMHELERPVVSLRPTAAIGDMYEVELDSDDQVQEMTYDEDASRKRREQRDRQADVVFDIVPDGTEDGRHRGHVERVTKGIGILRLDGHNAGAVHVRVENIPIEAAEAGADIAVEVLNDRVMEVSYPSTEE